MKHKFTHSLRHQAQGVTWMAILLGGAASITGCVHRGQRMSPPTNPRLLGSTTGTHAAVPLPERTPFDDDARLRAIFLESYANGYVLAATNSEYASPGCLCEAGGDPRKYDAMADGFFAGREAGAKAYRAGPAAAGK